jgi:NADH-quinone oxidoreductase subunit M
MGLLSLIIWLPLLGAAAILFVPPAQTRAIRTIALAAAGLSFLLSLYAAANFDTTTGAMQFVESLAWVPEMGMAYTLGLDGLSLPMVLLTTFISLACLLASAGMTDRVKAYFAWFMLLETAVLGVFAAQDWFLFYMFWEITLVPMFFLIGVWGGERKGPASLSFFLYTLGGSIFMLLGIIAVYANSTTHTFDMALLQETTGTLSVQVQAMIFLGFFLGLAVKIPAFPLHGWLPLAHVEAPVPVSMFLSAILLKMGAYGLFRAGALLPTGLEYFLPILFGLGLVNIVYGALMAWRQTDLKAMVAFSSISHMGFVLVGVAALTVTGFTGAVLQMVTHGIITAALFFLIGVIYDQAHTRTITEFSGMSRQMPMFGVFFALAFLASMGLPGLAGFVSEFHVILGAFTNWGLYVAIISIGVLVTADYSLRTIGRTLTGTFDPRWAHLRDVTPAQMIVAVPLTALIIGIGIFPSPLLNIITPSVTQIISVVTK